jgi:hypothetical protein
MSDRKPPNYPVAIPILLWAAWAQSADAPSVERCPGAAAWNRSHPAIEEISQAQDSNRAAISDAGLLKELHARVETDQAARRKWLADPDSEELARAVDAIDTENVAWLRKLITEKGFPKAAQVGNKGVHLAWLLSQHADQDPKLQSDLLPVLEQRHAAGELPANDLARSIDRILVAGGKPQKYGTQFDWFAGTFELPEPSALAAIDAERMRLGLMPLADYVCTLRVAREAIK